MGEVYEVSHSRLAGRYAMKVLRSDVAATPEALLRFQREAQVTSALQHPNIVQVIDSTIDGDLPYLVMEFLDGPELAQVMKRAKGLPMPQVVSCVKQIASGLMAAHGKDVVHRDLKPENIFVLRVIGNEHDLIKIVDFGISKINASTITSASTFMGTAQYMSPEQARGRIDEIDARTDQFALALIVYEMLTGEHAFRGDNISSLVYQIVHEEPPALVGPSVAIPPAVASVLKRALSKDKARRFQTVKAFADALEGAATEPLQASGNTIAAQPSVLDAGVATEATSGRRARLGAGLAALVIAGVAGVLLLRTDPLPPRPPDAGTRCGFTMPNPTRTGLPNPASYSENAVDGTVTDNVTGLSWQGAVAPTTVYTQGQAMRHCAGERGGWRLPTRVELVSLVDFTRPGPMIDPIFKNTPAERFWTSSYAASDQTAAWYVGFDNGSAHQMKTDNAYKVRCVRAVPSQCPPTRHQVQADGSVRDTATGLTWQRAVAAKQTWSDAKTFCPTLGTGWRLPSVTELTTIVDETKENPSIDGDAFPNTPALASYFWTSSPQVGNPLFAWYVTFIHGHADLEPVTTAYWVRCVR
jgi:tRNA A-37 threonylcarbamoyl transferase component Bud32